MTSSAIVLVFSATIGKNTHVRFDLGIRINVKIGRAFGITFI